MKLGPGGRRRFGLRKYQEQSAISVTIRIESIAIENCSFNRIYLCSPMLKRMRKRGCWISVKRHPVLRYLNPLIPAPDMAPAILQSQIQSKSTRVGTINILRLAIGVVLQLTNGRSRDVADRGAKS